MTQTEVNEEPRTTVDKMHLLLALEHCLSMDSMLSLAASGKTSTGSVVPAVPYSYR